MEPIKRLNTIAAEYERMKKPMKIDPKKAKEFTDGFNEPVKERLTREFGNLKAAFGVK